MNRPRSGTDEEIRKGLEVCGQWVYDGHGDAKKDCPSCPFQDETDPCGMNCGERLMRDAGKLIDELKAKILELEEAFNRLGIPQKTKEECK